MNQVIEITRSVEEMTEETMVGTLMKAALTACKNLPKLWHQLTEAEQQKYIDTLEEPVRAAVNKAITVLAEHEGVMIEATLEKVVGKDGLQATLEMSQHVEGRHELLDAVGQVVHVLIIDRRSAKGEAGRPKADKDQPELPLSESLDQFKTQPAEAQLQLTYNAVDDMPRDQRDALVQKASDLVVAYQVASVSFLQSQLSVSPHIAGQLLAILAEGAIVSTPDDEGRRTVLVPTDSPKVWIQPRVCGCELNDSVNGSGDGMVPGLQDCPGFEPDDDDEKQCKHCAHDVPCHAKGDAPAVVLAPRACSCDVHNDELTGSANDLSMGLQECPGFEPQGEPGDMIGLVCNHCSHEEKCHARPEVVPPADEPLLHEPQLVVEEVVEPVRDELFETAKRYVQGPDAKLNISALQRRLNVGYNRAARIMEQLEAAGIVSTMGEGARELLEAGAFEPAAQEDDGHAD